MSTTIPFTFSERTVKRYTVADAVRAAQAFLFDKYKLRQVCVNCVRNRSNTDTITLVELNNISEDLVQDTLYYDGYKAYGDM